MANRPELPSMTPVTITLYHLVWMIKRMPNDCSKVFLLNQYMSAPSRVEELYILSVLNANVSNCESQLRYSYNQSNNLWEHF